MPNLPQTIGFGGFIVYPNPADDFVVAEVLPPPLNGVVGEQYKLGGLKIYDMGGVVVFSTAEQGTKITVPTQQFAAGEYILKTIIDGKEYQEKFVIQR